MASALDPPYPTTTWLPTHMSSPEAAGSRMPVPTTLPKVEMSCSGLTPMWIREKPFSCVRCASLVPDALPVRASTMPSLLTASIEKATS
eukprot:365319-Chlamydomonas_euryale.AAC.16